MNNLVKILDEIKFTIPNKILKEAFKEDHSYRSRNAPFSLDNEIKRKVLNPRFLVDCDLVGGQEAIINLFDLKPNFIDYFSMVYDIPPDRLNYKPIMSSLSISNLPYPGSGVLTSPGSVGNSFGGPVLDTANAANMVMNSNSMIPDVSTSRVDIIGDNTIMVRNNQRVSAAYQFRCILANDPELQNINPRYIKRFAAGAILCVKSYIYNTLRVDIDSGFLTGGQELGYIKEYVDGLADYETMYQEFLSTVLRKVSLMNNSVEHERFLKRQFSPL